MNKSPWLVAPEELFTLRGHGGQRFSDFVSTLLRAEGAVAGATPDTIQTNTRVNLPDGGIDASACVPLGGSLGLTLPTAWQFKATEFRSIGVTALRKEANKHEAKRLIKLGFAYYVCVCDDAPPNKISTLEATLLTIVRKINPEAAIPRVLSAGHLADWTGRHPAIVLEFFRPQQAAALTYHAWLRKERADLRRFIELLTRASAVDAIRRHVGGTDAPARSVLVIAGPAGAGVSRLVAEALSEVGPRVIYVPDSAGAVGLTASLVNQPRATAILVVDRCTASTRAALEDLLRADGGRLRAIALQDPSELASDRSIALQPLADQDVQSVIDANFERVAPSHRRAFVRLADGILKIAARLATSYSVDPSRFLLNSASWADDELRRLIQDEGDREVLRAISLFDRVGYRGEVASQLESVSELFSLSAKDVISRCKRLALTPGFVFVGPSYLSVRPRLFARPLFETAWAQVAAEAPAALLDGLPMDLRSALLKQARVHAPQGARDAIVEWALPQIRACAPGDLSSWDAVELLLLTLEVSPLRMAPVLSDLVVRMSDGEARAPGERPPSTSWPARMHVLWALRQMLERRETYPFAETALFRLVRSEGDPETAARNTSSATEMWSASFRVYLSGTEVSFQDRLAVLAKKIDVVGGEAIPFVVVALGHALDAWATKIESTPIPSGQVRPIDWQPQTAAELWESLGAAVALLGRCISVPPHGPRTLRMLLKHGRGLLQSGRMASFRAAVENYQLDELERVGVHGILEDFVRFDAKDEDGDAKPGRYPADYVEAVLAWRSSLERPDLSSRALMALSRSFLGHQAGSEDPDAWTVEIGTLAGEFLLEPSALEGLIPSLVNAKEFVAPALFELGSAIGGRDDQASLLTMMFSLATPWTNPLLMRGSVFGVSRQGETHDSAVLAGLAQLEAIDPGLAVDLSSMNSRVGDAGARAIRLVKAGRIPPRTLGQVSLLRTETRLLGEALEAILEVMSDQPEDAAATALDLLGPLAWNESIKIPTDGRTLDAIWTTLELAIAGARGEAHGWGRVLRRVSELDLDKAIRITCNAALNGDWSMQEAAESELAVLIARDAARVLETFGALLLKQSDVWRFSIRKRSALFNRFPVEMLKQWILDNGVYAARIVAPHVPDPLVDQLGNAVVPPLTEFVLERFEGDEEVFSGFCAAGHNFQTYLGDAAAQHDGEVAVAVRFQTHRLRRIREWSEREMRGARLSAQWAREREEEAFNE